MGRSSLWLRRNSVVDTDNPGYSTAAQAEQMWPLALPSAEEARALRGHFATAGYEEAALKRLLGYTSPIRLEQADLNRVAERLRGQGALRILIQLFFLEQPVSAAEFDAQLAPGHCVGLEKSGLVRRTERGIESTVLLVPVAGHLVAGDRYRKLAGDQQVDHVLSINPPARLLAKLAVRLPVGSLLDLGTGNGIFAILLAGHARKIVATDLNARALAFARFNVALNGVAQVELREGSLFAPVAGERFDQIICNPPYIITPARRLVSTESEEELDGFCRKLVSQAPDYLNERGIMQIICEWIDDGSRDWRDYLAGWFAELGCDVWAICSGYTPIEDYARRRREQSLAAGAADDDEGLAGWLEYFRDRGVTGIRSGFIQLRRRRGSNWRSYTSLFGGLSRPVGAEIVSGFAARDRFTILREDELLNLSPLPAPTLVLEKNSAGNGGMRLYKKHGLPVSLVVSPAMVELVRQLDGKTQLKTVSAALARRAGVEPQAAAHECAQVARELLCQELLLTSDAGLGEPGQSS